MTLLRFPTIVLTITGFHVGVYRIASRIVLATVWSLDSAVRKDTRQRVIVERRTSNTVETAPTAIPIFLMAIAVHHHLFKWPDYAEARAINDALLWRD